ncbi:MAG TPA: hypothetical protein VGQ88_08910, partial [Burkholderiales bacterium]|nr:hypothetical protein [Burkholderiales bacterium]
EGRSTEGRSAEGRGSSEGRESPAPRSNEGDGRRRNRPSGGFTFGVGPPVPAAPSSRGGASDDLATTGPKLPASYRIGAYAVQGYVRGGWPFVIDFLPERNSRTWLEVSLDGRLRFTQLLDSDGSGGRRLVDVVLPADLPAAPRPGMYVIRSIRVEDGRRRQGRDGKDMPADVQLYGIGAGPSAVGSVAVEEVVFEPGLLRLVPSSQISATYSYNAKSEFNRVAVEILRFVNRDGSVTAERVKSDEQVGVRLGRSQLGSWDGTKQNQAVPSVGVHRLQVRAWFNSEDKSWVGAWSPNTVTVAP